MMTSSPAGCVLYGSRNRRYLKRRRPEFRGVGGDGAGQQMREQPLLAAVEARDRIEMRFARLRLHTEEQSLALGFQNADPGAAILFRDGALKEAARFEPLD